MMAWFKHRVFFAATAGPLCALLSACDTSQAESTRTVHSEAQPEEALRPSNAEALLVTVYKNPTCECCAEWAEHLEENGFRVKLEEGADLNQIRAKYGVSNELASCHTALVDGYVIEGHVPADLIQKLLRERPRLTGLAVPGMPAGVIGMPDAGPNRDKYSIVAFGGKSKPEVYAER